MNSRSYIAKDWFIKMPMVCPDGSANYWVVNIAQRWKREREKNMVRSEKSVARIILVGETLQEWRKEQKEDPSI